MVSWFHQISTHFSSKIALFQNRSHHHRHHHLSKAVRFYFRNDLVWRQTQVGSRSMWFGSSNPSISICWYPSGWIDDPSIFGFVGNVDLEVNSRSVDLTPDGRVRLLFDHYLSGYCNVHPMYFPYNTHGCFIAFQKTERFHSQELFRLKYATTMGEFHPEWNITHFWSWPVYSLEALFPNQSYPGQFNQH